MALVLYDPNGAYEDVFHPREPIPGYSPGVFPAVFDPVEHVPV